MKRKLRRQVRKELRRYFWRIAKQLRKEDKHPRMRHVIHTVLDGEDERQHG